MSYDPYQQDFYERDAVGLGEGVYGLGGSYGMGDSGVYGSGEGVYELGGRLGSGYPDQYDFDDAGMGGFDRAHSDGDVWDSTAFLDSDIPLVDAWGGGEWAEPQYQLADLMSYSRQLELDQALSDAERQRRFEERLAWEEMEESERARKWRIMDLDSRRRLGVHVGWWGSHYGTPLDLTYLRRSVPLTRGIFSTPFRALFSRHQGLTSRFSPYLSRGAIRGYSADGARFSSYEPTPLSAPGLDLRTSELQTRLRLAQTRASMTGLRPEARARAVDDARRIQEQINMEHRTRREFDRELATDNRLDIAREQAEDQREYIREMQDQRDQARLFAAGRPGLGGYGAPVGGYGGAYAGGGMSGLYGVY